MKNYFLSASMLFLALFFGVTATAQTALVAPKTVSATQPDIRLSELYDADYLQRLQTLQPDFLQRLNFYLDNSYRIVPSPEGKTANFETVLLPVDPSSFNILKMERERNIYRDKSNSKYLRIEGSTNLLLLLSEDDFVKAFNAATGRAYPKQK